MGSLVKRAASLLMDVLFGKEDAEPYVSKTNGVFTGNCMVRQHTMDKVSVGPCWHPTYNGRCPVHGNVTVYLDDLAHWPKDYEL